MKNILLPTDFSDNSWNAIQFALHLFKNQNCTFHLLNVYTPVIYDVGYFEVGVAQAGLIDSMKLTSKKGLDKMLHKINKNFKNKKHSFSEMSSFNTLATEIEELYIGNVVDFIVMGTQGASGLKEVLFGSNMMHVLKNSRCPVLAIPSNFSFESPYEILFPSDYEVTFQNKHLQPIKKIMSLFNSRINIIHVSYGYDLSEMQLQNKKELEESFKEVTSVFHDVANESVPHAIANFQLKTKVNLLVMINNKHSFLENLFFKSTIKQIGFHLNIPFLVIPSKI
jgi:nucleotide-binding universal stress UspA family protein